MLAASRNGVSNAMTPCFVSTQNDVGWNHEQS